MNHWSPHTGGGQNNQNTLLYITTQNKTTTINQAYNVQLSSTLPPECACYRVSICVNAVLAS